MAVPKVSTRVTHREKRGKFVVTFVKTYRQQVTEAHGNRMAPGTI